MATIIFMLLFFIVTNISAYNPKFKNKSFCECSENHMNRHDFYISKKGVKFGITVKTWSKVQIKCEDNNWNDFTFTRIPKSDEVDLMKFENCSLPEETSLKNIVLKLGIIEKNRLSFQSYKNLSNSLKKEHFEGFSNVKKLILTYNGLTNISSDFFRNFPNLRLLDLSENSLVLSKDNFNETPNLDKLYLHRNGLTELPLYIFHNLLNLRALKLQRNSLQYLPKLLFEKLESLQYLDLSSNLLSHFSNSIFKYVYQLRTLDFSNNYFNSLPLELFQNNKKLKRLSFTNNKALLPTLTGDLLTDLENLEIIHLKGNGFRSLTENLFWGSTSLKYIDLNENSLEELPELIFFELIEIEYLLLSRNLIEILPDEIFKYLKYLEVLDLSYNRIVYVPRILLKGLTSLRELYMEGNRLIYINSEAFSTNKQLSIAKFSNNLLTFSYEVGEMSPFYNNRRLKELHLGNNRIQYYFFDWTINKGELEILDLSYNNISVISANYFVFTSNKFVVDLRHNNINNILLTNIENLAIYYYAKRDVIVYVENNPLSCNCSLYDIVRYLNGDMPITVYNFFELRLGNLTCVKPNGIQGPQINQLDFKTYQCPEDEFFQIEKKCQTMCSCNIRPYDKMRVLDCSYNKISVFYIDKNKLNMKGNYPLTLNLTGNNLKFIPSLKDLESFNLTHLLLSNNKIAHFAVYRLPKTIEVLELHNNNLVKLNFDAIHYLYYQDLKEFTLSGNPFICDCASKYLHELVSKKQDYYKDLKNVKCKDQNITLVKMTVKQLCPSNDTPEKIIKTMEYNETFIKV